MEKAVERHVRDDLKLPVTRGSRRWCANVSRQADFLRPDLEFSAARDPRRWRVDVPHDAGFVQGVVSSCMAAAVATLRIRRRTNRESIPLDLLDTVVNVHRLQGRALLKASGRGTRARRRRL